METIIFWFRSDLRLEDNPGLAAACEQGRSILPIFVLESDLAPSPGAAARWWLHHALADLGHRLHELESPLRLFQGSAIEILTELAPVAHARAVYWTRRYRADAAAIDADCRRRLQERGIECREFPGALLAEPETLLNLQGKPYKVFTPFWKALQKKEFGKPLPAPKAVPPPPDASHGIALDRLGLLPRIPWDEGLKACWRIGEGPAHERLADFLHEDLPRYSRLRDIPAEPATSRLSPYLHFGHLSPRQVWQAVRQCTDFRSPEAEKFLSELAWREFAYYLLHHFPEMAEKPLDPRFERFPWRRPVEYASDLTAWQRGLTGIPLVDAGMRELWHTGWMHNRVRMVVASFLCKNLLIPWQEGAQWFWDTLVDADIANNTLGWQWVAGCGADAAPYFRIFNPVLQGQKFDPDGTYVRRWCPELARLPVRWIHRPWEAPARIITESGIDLGVDYPLPIADLSASRKRALAAFAQIKAG